MRVDGDEHSFITRFLAAWGDSESNRHHKRRRRSGSRTPGTSRNPTRRGPLNPARNGSAVSRDRPTESKKLITAGSTG